MRKASDKYWDVCIYLALALTTLAVFWQVRSYSFINYDDNDYVSENLHVQAGLTREGIIWAFTTGHGNNWHPVTWLSHMLDCQLFGTEPGRHHLTNLLLHIINTLLLFAIFKQMTGALWQSAFVAGAFALHPLHVESVAWVSERKDVLSTLFWVLTMAAYLRYVKRPRVSGYLLMLLVFSLGLMAKPMLVTLPFVLLLLDYWPLGRFQNRWAKDISRETRKSQKSNSQYHSLYFLVREKFSLFVLSAISSVVTVLIEGRRAGSSLDWLPLRIRFANAPVAYLTYLGKMIWPSKLAVFYPHPGSGLAMWQGAVAGVVLVGISILVIRLAGRYRYLPMGWFWYLGTLVPVIGLVQVGDQAMADRYTYIPLVGVFVIVAWGFGDLLAKWRFRRIVIGAASLSVFLALSICTYLQQGYWRNSFALFEHALAVTRDNSPMHSSMGMELVLQGRIDEAIIQLNKAVQIKPNNADAHNNMGNVLLAQGKLEEAISHFRQALKVEPDFAKAQYNLGLALKSQGKINEAISCYRRVLQIDPDFTEAHNNLGIVLVSQGKLEEAISHYRQALKNKPYSAELHNNIGVALQSQGRFDEAISHYRQALGGKTDSVELHNNLAWILATCPDPKLRRPGEAVEFAEHAAKLTRYQSATVLNTLAAAYAAAGRFDDAIATAKAALALASAAKNDALTSQIRKELEIFKQAKR